MKPGKKLAFKGSELAQPCSIWQARPGLVVTLFIVALAVAAYHTVSSPQVQAASTTVVISEVEADPLLGGTDNANEWFELFNKSATSITLSGWTITDNINTDTIPTITLGAGERVLVVATTTGFLSEHAGFTGTLLPIVDGAIGNGLANGGDVLTLRDDLNAIIDCVVWGTGTGCFSPTVAATAGNTNATLQRAAAGTDNDAAGDWTNNQSETPQSVAPTAVKLISFNAASYKGGQTLLEWRTGFEVDNLGFNIYRDQAGSRTRVTPQMVAGSALLVGARTNLMSGRSYEWLDSVSNDKDARYWLEAIDLDGQSVWHGPFAVDRSLSREALPARRSRAALLSSIGRSDAQLDSTRPVARAANALKPTVAQFALQSDLATWPAIKLSIRQEGWYRVTQPELIAAGLDSKIDPRNLQLFAEGQEQPLMIRGEDDGHFDSSDAIEFYGLGLDTPSTDERAYWLVTKTQAGSRIKRAKGRGARAASESFDYTVERKDKTVYFSSLRNGEKENFFGAVIAGDPVDQALFIRHVDQASAEDATLEVTLQGVTAPPHLVKVQINGRELGEISFLSQAQGTARYAVPHAALQEGENTITLTRRGDDSDVSLVDSIRLTYRHTYTADDNALRFTASSKQRVTIDGFNSASIRVIDVTVPGDAREVRSQVEQRGSGYGVTVSVPKGGGPRLLLAFSDDQVKQPARITFDQPSDLRNNGRQADFVIITRREFFASVEPLKQQRQSQGLSVAVVDVDEIYDEFNHGEKSPKALKDFLAYAKASWSKAPRFVLLVGDASFDSRNYLGNGDGDVVPTKLVDTVLMETASDEWLADFDGDNLAEIAIGRLPARTSHEAVAMIEKIISYAPARTDGVLLVSDSNDEGIDFEGESARLRHLIPSGFSIETINRGQMSGAAAKGMVLDAIKRGQKIINYFGHGSVDVWRGELLTSADAKEMATGDGLSILLSITCLNGYFHDAAIDSLAESFIKVESGGAVAVWASSGMCGADDQALMNQAMFRLIFDADSDGEALTLGEATLKAKTFISDSDIRRTYILFGDPTMRVR